MPTACRLQTLKATWTIADFWFELFMPAQVSTIKGGSCTQSNQQPENIHGIHCNTWTGLTSFAGTGDFQLRILYNPLSEIMQGYKQVENFEHSSTATETWSVWRRFVLTGQYPDQAQSVMFLLMDRGGFQNVQLVSSSPCRVGMSPNWGFPFNERCEITSDTVKIQCQSRSSSLGPSVLSVRVGCCSSDPFL